MAAISRVFSWRTGCFPGIHPRVADDTLRRRSFRIILPYSLTTMAMLLVFFFAVLDAGNPREHRSGAKVATPLWNDTVLTPDQLKSIARTLLPLGLAGCPDTLFLPFPGEFRPCVYIDHTESDPVRIAMSMRQSGGTAKVRTNAFELLAGFELTSAPSLRMPPRQSSDPLLLQFPVGKYSSEVVIQPEVDDPFVPGSKVEMKIVAYPGGMGVSTIEFVSAMLDERFDSVWKIGDLKRFGATSVRCRQRSVFRNVAGTYFAIVAFDARVRSGPEKCMVKPVAANGDTAARKVRYLITLRSDSDIEEKAECILQNVLSRFDRGG